MTGAPTGHAVADCQRGGDAAAGGGVSGGCGGARKAEEELTHEERRRRRAQHKRAFKAKSSQQVPCQLKQG